MNNLISINQFLSILGYQDGEKIFLRLINPIIGQSRKITRNYPLIDLPKNSGYNTYFVVNGQGNKNADIKHGRVFWIEHDDMPKADQLNLWKKLNLPEPTAQVDTGGKSIHSYWKLSENVDRQKWQELENDLIDFTKADKSIKNISRILRLPNCDYHNKITGQVTGQSKIINLSGKSYSYAELRSVIPENKPDLSKISLEYHPKNSLSNDKKYLLLNDALSFIPIKSDGQYQEYRELFCAIKNEFSLDYAIDLATNYYCKYSSANWVQIIQSSHGNYGMGTIIYFAEQYGFNYIDWLKKNNDNNKVNNWGTKEKAKEITKEEYEKIQKEKFRQEKLAILNEYKKFTPDKSVNIRYISDTLNKIDSDGKIIACKSAKNTGKTKGLIDLVGDKKESGDGYILIGNRCLLTHKNSNQLNLEYISPDKNRDYAEQVLSRATHREYYDEIGLGIVIDSLLKLTESEYENKKIIIDEANQLVDSLLLSNTYIKSVRGKVINQLKRICESAKSIILLDADLSDHTVDFFERLSEGNLETFKIENKYQENSRKAYIYPDIDSLTEELRKAIISKKKVFITSDSARELTAINDLIKPLCKSILLTQDNLADNPQSHDYLDNNGKLIKDADIDCVLLSPVGQSGLSIEIDDYFDYVFHVGFAVIPTDITRQILIRDRSNCDRHIFIKDRGFGYKCEYNWKEIIKNEDFKTEQQVIGSQMFSQLGDSYEESIIKQYQAIIEGKDETRKLAEKYTAQLLAKHNIEKSEYKSIVISEMRSEGYNVIELENEENIKSGFRKQIGSQKTKNKWKEANGTFAAANITDEEARELDNKPALPESDRLKLKKHKIRKALPELDLSPEFIFSAIVEDRFRTVNGITNYFMVKHPEIAKTVDYNDLAYQITQADNDGIFWQFDLRHRTAINQIYKKLELDKLLNEEKQLTSSEIEKLVKRFKWHQDYLKVFNIKFGKYPVQTLRKIIELFGFELIQIGKKSQARNYLIRKKLFKGKYENGDRFEFDYFDNIYSSLKIKYSDIQKKEISLKSSDCISTSQNYSKPYTEKEIEVEAHFSASKNLNLKSVPISNSTIVSNQRQNNLSCSGNISVTNQNEKIVSENNDQKKQLEEVKLWEWAREIINDDGSVDSYAYKRIICGLSQSLANQLNELLNEILPF